jgi:hypothetical protein
MPSAFTGSFWLSAGAADELVCEIHARDEQSAPNLTVNWREPTRDIV